MNTTTGTASVTSTGCYARLSLLDQCDTPPGDDPDGFVGRCVVFTTPGHGNVVPMESAVQRYCNASAEDDVDGMLETLAPDAELVSPISGRMVFRGKRDLGVLLGAIYGTITELRWQEQVRDGHLHVAMGRGRVGPLQLGDAMVFELAADGRIQRIRPHLRPWLAVTFLALRLAARLIRHPGVASRALGVTPRRAS